MLTPSQDALSAVNAAAIALDLLARGQATDALAEVTLDGAVDQLASDERSVATMQAKTPAQQMMRRSALDAIRQATSAAVEARDAASTSQSTSTARDDLSQASHHLQQVTGQLEGAR